MNAPAGYQTPGEMLIEIGQQLFGGAWTGEEKEGADGETGSRYASAVAEAVRRLESGERQAACVHPWTGDLHALKRAQWRMGGADDKLKSGTTVYPFDRPRRRGEQFIPCSIFIVKRKPLDAHREEIKAAQQEPNAVSITPTTNDFVSNQATTRKGRKPSDLWDTIFIEAACLAVCDGIPPSQSKFIEAVQQRVELKIGAERNVPRLTQMKDRIGPLYNAIRAALAENK